MGVLNNTLYIFCDFTTGVWSNSQAVFPGTNSTFPWKKNSTYNWNFGIANPSSLDVSFGKLVFLAQNSDGLLQFMASTGGQPESITAKSVATLLQRYINLYGDNSPFLQSYSNGFLYQYEDTVFYRMSGGQYHNDGILNQTEIADSIEYNFETDTWHKVIELNGQRNRIQDHIYFKNKHLVTVNGENTIYEMSGQFYINEIRNPDQPDEQSFDAYLSYPIRYEGITEIISMPDYAEFETDYGEIDFVFGESDINYSTAPFLNSLFLTDENGNYIISETPDSDGQPVYILSNQGDTPSLSDKTYNSIYKPTVELWFSDDGGISFQSADVREFSQMGVYQWRMRWYQLGPSRNRVYKLIAVSPVPIIVLGANMFVRRMSGGAN